MRRGLQIMLVSMFAGVLFAQAPDSTTTVIVQEIDPLYKDIRALCSTPHRLSGSSYGQQAASYLGARMRSAGVDTVLELHFPVWTLEKGKCELIIDNNVVPLTPVVPNITIAPATPAEGIAAPYLYAGHGELHEYGNRDPAGAIVGLEYDCGSNWKRAFSAGARAVVFLGNGNETNAEGLATSAPINLVRVFADQHQARLLNLRSDRDSVVLFSQVVWKKRTATTIAGFLSGTAPGAAKQKTARELLLATARYDSYGDVPFVCKSARLAANSAAVLDAARYFAKRRPQRDMLFVLFDAGAFYHSGARLLYSALFTDKSKFSEQMGSTHDEKQFNERLLAALGGQAQPSGYNAWPHLLRKMSESAEFCRSEENVRLSQLRGIGPANTLEDEHALRIEWQKQIVSRWDDARSSLAAGTFNSIEDSLRTLLELNVRSQIQARLAELTTLQRSYSEQQGLRTLLGNHVIALHVDYEFSSDGDAWGVVAADQTDTPFPSWDADGDKPSHHAKVLRILQNAARRSGSSVRPLEVLFNDPLAAPNYVHAAIAANGAVAGTFGVYHVAMVTCFDRRSREGTPADNLELFRWELFAAQARQGHRLLHTAANSAELSIDRAFSNKALLDEPMWGGGKSKGNFVGLQVTGAMAEDRPASDAILALWPLNGLHALRQNRVPGFERFCLEQVTAEGRYQYSGCRQNAYSNINVLGTIFDSTGIVSAISNTSSFGNKWRVNLFPAQGFAMGLPLRDNDAGLLNFRILGSASNADFKPERSLEGRVDGFVFAYVHATMPPSGIKVFSTNGPVLLHSSIKDPYGAGLSTDTLSRAIVRINETTAHDMWQLNEARLGLLREKAISNAGLELLHGRSRRLIDLALAQSTFSVRQALFARSAALSRRVYEPVRALMDDLVKAIVILLLLAIPFAFCLERLLVGAASVYGRIGWFSLFFAITFMLLYLLHPGFSIAAAPAIVFIAFAIILLSSAVIQIMTRKFKTEIMALQGRGSSVHTVAISRMDTLMVAVNMGMSTMRRRPVRTALTTITALMLTFTIVCFASFSGGVGVRRFYVGAGNENPKAAFFVRNVNYAPLAADLPALVGTGGRDDGSAVENWWYTKSADGDGSSVVIKKSGSNQSISLDGVLGFDPEELTMWPSANAVFPLNAQTTQEELAKGSVFLPSFALRRLGLSRGDSISIKGLRVRLGGAFDEASLQRLNHIDGQSVIPVNFSDIANTQQVAASTTDALASGTIQGERDFTRLSAAQIAVSSNAIVERLGGKRHLLTVYARTDATMDKDAQRLAETLSLPVWANTDNGVVRIVFTTVTTVHGLGQLFVPILLGGLIIFATLLGSITDRQKEIYTFSALGLGPAHVGFLFFAEAAVYAVVGGMGGQLLAQLFAAAASAAASRGIINAVSINYSSTQSLSAIGIVMLTIMLSAIYPAIKASKSANPGIQRNWKMPAPEGDLLVMTFPFTVSSYDITGLVSFLAEYFNSHDDAGLGHFAASGVAIGRTSQSKLEVSARIALSPFDLGVSQNFSLEAHPSEIPGVDEVVVRAERLSGSSGDWCRSNRHFVEEIRKQFLIWRTLSAEAVEMYRMRTLTDTGVAKLDNAEVERV